MGLHADCKQQSAQLIQFGGLDLAPGLSVSLLWHLGRRLLQDDKTVSWCHSTFAQGIRSLKACRSQRCRLAYC